MNPDLFLSTLWWAEAAIQTTFIASLVAYLVWGRPHQ